jgi:two-component system, NarL family, sensor histidine kinase UhpB
MDDQLAPCEAPRADEPRWRAECRALSREVHDDIAHLILVMMCTLERVEMHQGTWEPAASRLFRDVREVAAATLEKARGLAARLRNHADGHQDTALCGESGDVPTELSYVLGEAVTNALAHAGARQIVIDVKERRDRIVAVVEDDGVGFEPEGLAPHEQVGLLSMRERAALIGGRLQVDTARHQGTRVTIHVPCRNAPHGGR